MATMTVSSSRTPQLSRLQVIGIVAGLLGIGGLAAGFVLGNARAVVQSYLFGFYFTMGLSIGCLGFLMVQHLTGGAWGVTVRRMLEAGTLVMPWMFILAMPIVLAAYNTYGFSEYIYHWADPAVVTEGAAHYDPIIAHKVPWLSAPWFAGRILIYFALWSGIAWLLRRWSLEQDRTGNPALVDYMRRVSGVGVALFVLSVTFFSFDVAMSLDPHWFSTIYGAHYMVSSGLTTLAFMILMLTQIRRTAIFQEYVPIKPIHDLGKLMFAFTVLWTYMSFGQLVIIWSGDVAEFTPWYRHRIEEGWLYLALALMALAFFGPFFALLGRKPKQNLNYLAGVATLIIAMRLVDVAWIVLPEFHHSLFEINLFDLAAPVGLVGVWLAIFIWNLQRAPLLPLNDPNMEILALSQDHH